MTQDTRTGLLCHSCGRFRYVRMTIPENTSLAEAAKTMSCHRCHSTDVELRRIVRDPETGRWPAEHG